MDTAQIVKMDPEVKAELVEALRTKYKQGKGYLRRTLDTKGTQGFCCLGVVCDLYNKKTGQGEWGSPSSYGAKFTTASDNSMTDLPPEVQRWSGLTNDEVRSKLAAMNDSDVTNGYTFSEIATWIDENL